MLLQDFKKPNNRILGQNKPILKPRLRTAIQGLNDDRVEEVLDPHNEVLRCFLNDVHEAYVEKLQTNFMSAAIRKKLHGYFGITESDDDKAISLLATLETQRIRYKVLKKLGLRHIGNSAFDYVVQALLPKAREDVKNIDGDYIPKLLRQFLRPIDRPLFERRIGSSLAAQREELAWLLAKEIAEDVLIHSVERNATRLELETIYAEITRPPKVKEALPLAPAPVAIINGSDTKKFPPEVLFTDIGVSPLSVHEWCTLPTRPAVIPVGVPERGATALAEFLFDKVLYSSQICDKQGAQVGVSQQVRQAYINKIVYATENDLPIPASIYMALVATTNPLEKNAQTLGLPEIDFLRRLAEISHAVEMYYAPGLRWIIINEATAFKGHPFDWTPEQVNLSHQASREFVDKIDPAGKRLTLLSMGDMLWGTPAREAQWAKYKAHRTQELRDALYDVGRLQHDKTMGYMQTFTYPMTTCLNPYQFELAKELSASQVMEVYAAIKAIAGAPVHKDGHVNETHPALQSLSSPQRSLLTALYKRGQSMTIDFRTVMDSRSVLPSFTETIPDHTLEFTIVTKKDKPVLYPNSGCGSCFPAHGEAVLVPQQHFNQRSVVTVRPWWQIVAQPTRYRPMYTPGRAEVLYFEEKR